MQEREVRTRGDQLSQLVVVDAMRPARWHASDRIATRRAGRVATGRIACRRFARKLYGASLMRERETHEILGEELLKHRSGTMGWNDVDEISRRTRRDMKG